MYLNLTTTRKVIYLLALLFVMAPFQNCGYVMSQKAHFADMPLVGNTDTNTPFVEECPDDLPCPPPEPSPTPSPSPVAQPSASPSASPNGVIPEASASPSASPGAEPEASASPSASPGAEPQASASPSASPNGGASPAPSTQPSAAPSPTGVACGNTDVGICRIHLGGGEHQINFDTAPNGEIYLAQVQHMVGNNNFEGAICMYRCSCEETLRNYFAAGKRLLHDSNDIIQPVERGNRNQDTRFTAAYEVRANGNVHKNEHAARQCGVHQNPVHNNPNPVIIDDVQLKNELERLDEYYQ